MVCGISNDLIYKNYNEFWSFNILKSKASQFIRNIMLSINFLVLIRAIKKPRDKSRGFKFIKTDNLMILA